MFEDNKYKESDLMMRSILEEGVEEVPAGVWDAVSEGLDKASRKKTVVLMWRRAAVGFGAAAALAIGLVLNHGSEETLVPEASGSDMIAVVEPLSVETAPGAEEDAFAVDVMMAQVRETPLPKTIEKQAEVPVSVKEIPALPAEDADDDIAFAEQMEEVVSQPAEEQSEKETQALTYRFNEEYAPSEWEEDVEKERRSIGTSLVFSGIAGTNGTPASSSTGLFRQPSISTAPPKTGVKETSTRSTYGIPLSFGTGVKIDFTDRWSLGVGLNYTLLTRRFYGSYTKVNETGAIERSLQTDIRNVQHYLGIPVNAFYNILTGRHVDFYAYAGGAVERCLSDKYQLEGYDITHTEKAKGVQLSANLGIGVEFLLGKHLGLYIDPSLRYYFDNGLPASIRTAQPLMLGFEMGLRVKL